MLIDQLLSKLGNVMTPIAGLVKANDESRDELIKVVSELTSEL